ncbi:MAG: peptidylprolyl isomerase [Cyanobacteriota bacterium]|nr:peptidylprolyl isomerase [Cyanobacteriota bacterium]
MSQPIEIDQQDILHQVKLSCQIPSLIEGIVTRKILDAMATEAGIVIEVEELQKAADQLRFVNKLLNTEDTWTWLNKFSLSLDDFEEMVRINVLSGKLAQHLFGEKVEPWFYEHQLDYAAAVLYEVVLDDEDLAMELFYELQEGEISFFEIAREYIQEQELQRKGGYLGTVQRQQMKAEVSAKVFAAAPPEVLKPIVTSQGVHLIQVEEIIQPELNNKLRYQILSDLFSAWLKQRVEEAEYQLIMNNE